MAIMLCIGGCATHQVDGKHEAVTDVSQLTAWSAQGRMGITGVPQAGSASFNWQQHDDVSQINLHGPLGVGAISLLLDDGLHITLGNGTHYDADAALRELELRMGAAVPIKQLCYWLRGEPAPGDYQWMNDANKVLQQDGWRIEYNESTMVNALQLPKKITATHDEVRIRVVIEEWKLR
jgi:outer membrane lipoprotein LolB